MTSKKGYTHIDKEINAQYMGEKGKVDFPFDLNNLFNMSYSFDQLKAAIEYLANQQNVQQHLINDLLNRDPSKETFKVIEKTETIIRDQEPRQSNYSQPVAPTKVTKTTKTPSSTNAASTATPATDKPAKDKSAKDKSSSENPLTKAPTQTKQASQAKPIVERKETEKMISDRATPLGVINDDSGSILSAE